MHGLMKIKCLYRKEYFHMSLMDQMLDPFSLNGLYFFIVIRDTITSSKIQYNKIRQHSLPLMGFLPSNGCHLGCVMLQRPLHNV